MRRLTMPIVGLLVGALLAPITAAKGDSSTQLSDDYALDVVVDEAHGRIFVALIGSVLVMDLDGVQTHILEVGYYPNRMSLNRVGSTLWIAAAHDSEIVGVNTTTLEMSHYAADSYGCLSDVAESAGLVWFTYGCNWSQRIGVLDPDTGEITGAIWPATPTKLEIETAHDAPGTLFVVRNAAGIPSLHALTATDEPAPTLIETTPSVPMPVERVVDMVATGSGDGVSVSTIRNYREYGIGLDLRTTVSASNLSTAVVRRDGMLVLGKLGALSVHRRPAGAVVGVVEYFRDYDFKGELQTSALAFGSTRMYFVYKHPDLGLIFNIVTPRAPSSLKLTSDRRRYRPRSMATITAKLTGGKGKRTVDIFATPAGKSTRLIFSGKTDSSGRLTTTLRVKRNTALRAAWAGTANVDPASDTVKVKSQPRISVTFRGDRGRSGRYHLYAQDQGILIQAKLSPHRTNRCMDALMERKLGSRSYFYATDCVALNRRGILRMRVRIDGLVGENLRLRLRFRGDRRDAPATSKWHYFRFVRS